MRPIVQRKIIRVNHMEKQNIITDASLVSYMLLK